MYAPVAALLAYAQQLREAADLTHPCLRNSSVTTAAAFAEPKSPAPQPKPAASLTQRSGRARLARALGGYPGRHCRPYYA